MKRLRARTAFGLGCHWMAVVALLVATSWSQLACACSSGLGCASHKSPQSAVATKCSCCGDAAEQSAESSGCCSKKPEPKKPASQGCCSVGHERASATDTVGSHHASLSTPSCVCSVQTPDRPAFPGREQDKIQPAKRVNDEPLPAVALAAVPLPLLEVALPARTVEGSPGGARPTPVLLCTFRC